MKIEVELSEKELHYLKQLQKNHKIQLENTGNSDHSIYVLVDYQDVVVDPDFESDAEVRFAEYHGDARDIRDINGLKEYLENAYPQKLAQFLVEDEYFDWEEDSDVDNLISEFEMYKYYVCEKTQDGQTFFSREAAEKHLEENQYHYSRKAFVDRRRSWRNDEMDTLIQLLCKLPISETAGNL